ncbi:hypothetical protein F4677DRAFT_446806 [Hypoxylon crocopeplum]|nr:hypothetical protein F4677DRAFT_446806 [Hypoxylon crocopeplum]
MSNKAAEQVASKGSRGDSTTHLHSNNESTKTPIPFPSRNRKHAALRGTPTVYVSAEQWKNVNQAIEKTVDLVIGKRVALDSFGPRYWEMDEGLGVALVAEIRRPIKEICTLGDLKLQRELRKMARDVTHKEFRFPYKGGGVWFRFNMTDLQKATKSPLELELDASAKAEETRETTASKVDPPAKIDEDTQ